MEAARMNDERIRAAAKRLSEMRDAKKITYSDVAEAAGVSRSAVSMLANRGMAVNGRALENIEKYLDAQGAPEAAQQGAQGAREYKRETVIYMTREFRQALGWCDYIQARRRMGVMIGPAGSGKTTALREFQKRCAGAHYIECWPMMRMGDLLGAIAAAAGATLSGSSNYGKVMQLVGALAGREDICLILDEAEYLRTWDVSKFEIVRKIWDNTGTPVIMAGTPELEQILTRGSGRENLAQLYRRKYEIRLGGISAAEVRQILAEYDISADAAEELTKIATDARHGGMGNFVEVLDICLDAAGAGRIDLGVVNGAKQYKLMY